MKCPGKIAIIVLMGFAGNLTALAGDLPSVKTPPATTEQSGQKTKLPEITPNGVMTLFGKRQVLFRVAGAAQSDGSTGESSFVLEVGESQNGIKVLAVDDASKAVTFDNHGTIQIIALQTATLVSAPASVPAPARPALMTLQSAPLQPVTPAEPLVEQPQDNGGATIITIGSRPTANATRFKHQLGVAAQDNQNQAGGAGFAPPPSPANTGAAAPVTGPTEASSPAMSQQPARTYPPQMSAGPGIMTPIPPQQQQLPH